MGVCASRPDFSKQTISQQEVKAPDAAVAARYGDPPGGGAAKRSLRSDTASENSDPEDALTEAYRLTAMCKQQPAAVVRGSAANAAAAVQWQPNRKPDQEPEKLPAEADRPPSAVLPDDLAVLAAADLSGKAYNSFERGPPLPPCNAARLRATQQCGPIDGPKLAELDLSVEHIIDLVCQVFRVQNAMLTLFGDNRAYIRNSRGFQKGDSPWRWSLCAWSMLPSQPEVLPIEDTAQDARFRDNELTNF